MNRLIFSLFLAALFSGVAFAAESPAAADEIVQRLTATSFKETVVENDPRLGQTRKLLDKAVKLTREEPMAIAAACSRYVGHLHDSAQIDATPLELLEALARFGRSGESMRDTLQAYVVARKAAPSRNHADAMQAMGKRK